ncbi:hypothetical protein U1Q18_042332 [Sarracenia purpurea var. burkii]
MAQNDRWATLSRNGVPSASMLRLCREKTRYSVGKLSLVRWFPVDVFGMYVIWSRFTRAVIKLECCGDFDTERHVPLLRIDFLSSVENTHMYDNVYPIDDAISDRYCFVENLKRIGKSHIRVCRRE